MFFMIFLLIMHTLVASLFDNHLIFDFLFLKFKFIHYFHYNSLLCYPLSSYVFKNQAMVCKL